ncbi:LOW QUALITY PROTEIN: TMV resistance protein N-like [Morus notabilis]|uniref:LOW QUALITY PROTEIN: TMV resistance protein N-like n=1 Tax=Morus notabilis TaxID=981085 RepID=UPI000CED662B|nr:LOW QUALITY PROTEIN: TMV resistance protein N-like [Morus notabilis]
MDVSLAFSSSKKYNVFISFRGEDTCNTFTSHLYTALCQKKIKTYLDEELKKGDEISPALLKAIEESKLSMIIFSQNYASSSWCLDELNHVLKCKGKHHKQLVVPVFYHVDPSHVRKQNGSYGVAFARHEERLKDKMDKVHQWRIALAEATNLSSWHIYIVRSESKLIEAIAKDIIGKLNNISSDDNSEDLVGIDKRVSQIATLLDIGSSNVRIVGLWGMGVSAKQRWLVLCSIGTMINLNVATSLKMLGRNPRNMDSPIYK